MRAKATGLAVLLTVPALLLASACSSDSDGDKDKGDTSTSDTSKDKPAGAANLAALSKSQLDKATLVTGDVAGYTIVNTDASKTDSKAKADDAKCQPIINAVGDKVNPAAKDSALRAATKKGVTDETFSVALTSYQGADAEKAMTDLKAALSACGSGFSATSMGQKVKYTSVTQKEATGGDDAVALTLTGEAIGQKITVNYVVARQGSTMAMFLAADPTAKKTVEVPQALVTKQTAKLAG